MFTTPQFSNFQESKPGEGLSEEELEEVIHTQTTVGESQMEIRSSFVYVCV